jgi:hypothetical protein
MEKMNEEPGLAIFLTWIDTLEATLSRYTTIVMPTSFSPLHLIDMNGPVNDKGIPIPTADNDMPGSKPKVAATPPSTTDQPPMADEAQSSAEVESKRPGQGS